MCVCVYLCMYVCTCVCGYVKAWFGYRVVPTMLCCVMLRSVYVP